MAPSLNEKDISYMEAPLIGEANVFDDDIDSFLAISKELKIKGLTDLPTSDVLQGCVGIDKSKAALTENKIKSREDHPSNILLSRDVDTADLTAEGTLATLTEKTGESVSDDNTTESSKDAALNNELLKIISRSLVFLEQLKQEIKPSKTEKPQATLPGDNNVASVEDVTLGENKSRALAIHSQFSGDLLELDEKVKPP